MAEATAAFDASARTSDRRDGGHSGLAPGTEGCELCWWGAPTCSRNRHRGRRLLHAPLPHGFFVGGQEERGGGKGGERGCSFGCFFCGNAGGRPWLISLGPLPRGDRRLRSWLRHERMTVRIALAEALHQSCGHWSSTTGPRRFSEKFAAETLFSQLARRKRKKRSGYVSPRSSWPILLDSFT